MNPYYLFIDAVLLKYCVENSIFGDLYKSQPPSGSFTHNGSTCIAEDETDRQNNQRCYRIRDYRVEVQWFHSLQDHHMNQIYSERIVSDRVEKSSLWLMTAAVSARSTAIEHTIYDQHEDSAGQDGCQLKLRTASGRIHCKPQISLGHLQQQKSTIKDSQISDAELPVYDPVAENQSEIIECKPSQTCIIPEEFNVLAQLNVAKDRDILEKNH